MASAKLMACVATATGAAVGGLLLRARQEPDRPALLRSDYRFSVPTAAADAEKFFGHPNTKPCDFLRSCIHKTICCFCEAENVSTSDLEGFRPRSSFYAGASRIVPLAQAISNSDRILRRYREQYGSPAVVAAISVDGRIVYEAGFGFADVEQCVHARPDTVMRIASISKCMTAAIAAYLVDCGWLDLDKPVHEYIGEQAHSFRQPDGSIAVITTRQLLSHMAGVRHYRKSEQNHKSTQTSDDDIENPSLFSAFAGIEKTDKATARVIEKPTVTRSSGDGQYPEFYLNVPYKTAQESLAVFKDDPLLTAPGEKYHYTTFGYTLLSAVLEKAVELGLQKQAKVTGSLTNALKEVSEANLLPTESTTSPLSHAAPSTVTPVADKKPAKNEFNFPRIFDFYLVKRLGLFQTCMDDNEKIIPNRARYYQRDAKTHALKNTPEVNNSCKWAGGGVLSSAGDLVRFGNALLMSHQRSENSVGVQTYLQPASVRSLWHSMKGTENPQGSDYGLGFALWPRDDWFRAALDKGTQAAYMQNVQTRIVYHSGGAVGASSILMILPRFGDDEAVIKNEQWSPGTHPRGVVVAIMCNLQDVGLYQIALELCTIFDRVQAPPLTHSYSSLT